MGKREFKKEKKNVDECEGETIDRSHKDGEHQETINEQKRLRQRDQAARTAK